MAEHAVGDEIVIRWPGGPHGFVIEYYDDGRQLMPSPSPGWQYLRGVVIEPPGPGWRSLRTFYVRPIEGGEYSLRALPEGSCG